MKPVCSGFHFISVHFGCSVRSFGDI